MTELLNWLLLHYGQETMNPGLERISRALSHFLVDLNKIRIITIAGTNGKGETTLNLSRYLRGSRHLVWTSPHVKRITERFRDENGEISLEELKDLVTLCHSKVQEEKYELTFYEFLFFVFCTWAVRKKPEFLLLEVGLGGRLDAVNTLNAELVLLTSISRDHQEFLGNRYDQILSEKLGVARKGKALISYVDTVYLRERVELFVQKMALQYIDLEELKMFSSFEFPQRNQLLAHAAFLYTQGVNLQEENYANWAPEDRFLENRGEVLSDSGDWIFFGSHNPDGLRKLIQFLQSANYNFSRPPYDAVVVAFSRREARDLRTMLRMLKSSSLGKVVVTSFEHPKAAPKDLVEELSNQEGITFAEDISQYIQKGHKHSVLVTGSYYFLGHFKSLIGC